MFLFIQWFGLWFFITIILSCCAKRLARRHRRLHEEELAVRETGDISSGDEEMVEFDADATFL